MSKTKVLYVVHNHPAVRPGGAEAYALEVYEALRGHPELEPVLLARTGPPIGRVKRHHEGTYFEAVSDDPGQHFFYTERSDFDWLFLTSRDKSIYNEHYRDFLLAHRPDVVHFQHTLYLGFDMIRATRNVLPHVPIVYTLHEYGPICHRNGQMVRTETNDLCLESSPRRCHECFPEIAPETFFLRKKLIQSHLDLVDMFLAPSEFLRRRYVDWGIPEERIAYEEYGRLPVLPSAERDEPRRPNRIGFFGQFIFFKGVHVLLRAMRELAAERHDAHLWLYGANLDMQPHDFQQEFHSLVAGADNVTLAGGYDHAELPKLIAHLDWVVVPSIWWENSPLVIQEAFAHGKPVICSDIGGMAEKVVDGVDGLHFRAGDPVSLARTIRRAADSPELWRRLRAGIRSPYAMSEHVDVLAGLYRELLDARVAEAVAG